MAPAADPILQIQIPGYRLDRKLGEGAMGLVYLATQLSIGRPVAVKLTPALGRSPKVIARFRREAQILGRLSHPHVVQVFDTGEVERYLFIVMEFVNGQSLLAAYQSSHRMSAPQVARAIEEVAMGLAAAHDVGVIHRDIKPGNILLDRRGWAKLADFGLARPDADSVLTTVGALIGTPFYMSPEQCRGETAEPASDVYSLGLTLYEGLAGTRPFDAKSPTDLLRVHQETTPQPLRCHAPDIDPEVDGLVTSMLAKKPANRPTSREVADVLHGYLARVHVQRYDPQIDARAGERVQDEGPATVDLPPPEASAGGLAMGISASGQPLPSAEAARPSSAAAAEPASSLPDFLVPSVVTKPIPCELSPAAAPGPAPVTMHGRAALDPDAGIAGREPSPIAVATPAGPAARAAPRRPRARLSRPFLWIGIAAAALAGVLAGLGASGFFSPGR